MIIIIAFVISAIVIDASVTYVIIITILLANINSIYFSAISENSLVLHG